MGDARKAVKVRSSNVFFNSLPLVMRCLDACNVANIGS
jgi:hypothetical protein